MWRKISKKVRELCGRNVVIISTAPVSGGDISNAWEIVLSTGESLFLKTNREERLPLFEAEREGLDAIRRTGCIRAPEVRDVGCADGDAWILMECAKGGSRNPDFWEQFGHALANMHQADPRTSLMGMRGTYGFRMDNFIGTSVQKNTPHGQWINFFRDCRLRPQFEMAVASGYFDKETQKKIDRFLQHLPGFLEEPARPALLHGDLWSGNFVTGPDGYAWLIDPAVYVGHPEADIAMTALFGGFDPRFYNAYAESGLLTKEYTERKDIYNLYHLLNHLNLFGSGYLPAVLQVIRHYMG